MKWNEVTWYSRLGALVLFFGVVPALAFYIGAEYQKLNQTNTVPSPIFHRGPQEVSPTPVSEEIKEPEALVPAVQPAPKPAPATTCYKGGCSGQLCTDSPDMVSTCEYTEAYACYQSAVCERQSNGQCGWTETPTLKMCLSDAGSI